MNKQQFLEELRAALSGEVNSSKITENLNYYESYINEEINKGRIESDVMQELGDPFLIAKTIIDMKELQSDTNQSSYENQKENNSYGREENDGRGYYHRIFDFQKWYTKPLLFLVVLLVIIFVMIIIGGVVSLLFPIVVPLFFLWLVLSIVRNNRR